MLRASSQKSVCNGRAVLLATAARTRGSRALGAGSARLSDCCLCGHGRPTTKGIGAAAQHTRCSPSWCHDPHRGGGVHAFARGLRHRSFFVFAGSSLRAFVALMLVMEEMMGMFR